MHDIAKFTVILEAVWRAGQAHKQYLRARRTALLAKTLAVVILATTFALTFNGWWWAAIPLAISTLFISTTLTLLVAAVTAGILLAPGWFIVAGLDVLVSAILEIQRQRALKVNVAALKLVTESKCDVLDQPFNPPTKDVGYF